MARILVVVPVHLDTPTHFLAYHRDLFDDDFRVVVIDSDYRPTIQEQVRDNGAEYAHCPQSRGAQIRQGTGGSTEGTICVVHVDSRLSASAVEFLRTQCSGSVWGRFSVVLPGLPVVAWFMNQRSRWTKICTGDQAMFMSRTLLEAIGGYPSQPLMEDIELSKRLKRQAPDCFVASRDKVESSPRRWQSRGVFATIWAMWCFRWRYWRGVPAEQLFKEYYPE